MHPLLPCSFALLLLLFSLSTLSLTDARELPSSFTIVPSDSPFLKNSNDQTIETDIIATQYTYLMKLKVTTDTTVETYAIPDTGSDLIVLNRENCKGEACHCQQTSACIKKPTIAEEFRCDDLSCKNDVVNRTCSEKKKEPCYYERHYGDGFNTKGVLIKGKFLFPIIGGGGSKDEEFDTIFGVSTESHGILQKQSEGIVGLGRGDLSLFKQLLKKNIHFNFSYCLPIYSSNSPGKLRVGADVTISDENSTPLLPHNNKDCKNRYCVHLKGTCLNRKISNDHKNIQVCPTTEENKKNKVMLIDTGSTFTNLTDELFNKFLNQVWGVIGHKVSKELDGYKHCFKEEDAKKLEKVSFEFEQTTIDLKQDNFFESVKEHDTSYRCLTIAKIEDKEMKVNILGNRAQMNFKVAFAIKHWKVSFDEATCGKENLE